MNHPLLIPVFFTLFFSIFGAINYWIGVRCWQFFFRYIPFVNYKAYWVVFWIIALSFFAARFGRTFLPGAVANLLAITGSIWFGAIVYLSLGFLCVEVLRLLNKIIHLFPAGAENNGYLHLAAGSVILFITTAVLVYGWWNANNPKVRNYNIVIPKQAGIIRELRLAAVSDLHLGLIVNKERLDRMVTMINGLKPDLVLLLGDQVDERPDHFIKQDMAAVFKKLTPKYGVYAVPGNHEYLGGKYDDIALCLKSAGVKLLNDQVVCLDNSFYIIGRDDIQGATFSGDKRKELDVLTAGLDKSLPLILLDHQPAHLEQAQANSIDLQLSGHTHHGQLFPFNFITKSVFANDWGYSIMGSSQFIVSCGFGTWGPPIRLGSTPEILNIKITFL